MGWWHRNPLRRAPAQSAVIAGPEGVRLEKPGEEPVSLDSRLQYKGRDRKDKTHVFVVTLSRQEYEAVARDEIHLRAAVLPPMTTLSVRMDNS